jgi:hypothetical protein
MLIYFLKGGLPWKLFDGSQHLILSAKQNYTRSGTLFDGIPNEFLLFFNHVQSLQYADKPDYIYLRKLFSGLFVASKFLNDSIFDWEFLDSQCELLPDVI